METQNSFQEKDGPTSHLDKGTTEISEPQETKPALGKQRKWGLIRAGEILDRPLIAICTECEAELTFEPRRAARPCGRCGNDTFRSVS
jgi:hypothetical protein